MPIPNNPYDGSQYRSGFFPPIHIQHSLSDPLFTFDQNLEIGSESTASFPRFLLNVDAQEREQNLNPLGLIAVFLQHLQTICTGDLGKIKSQLKPLFRIAARPSGLGCHRVATPDQAAAIIYHHQT